MKAAVVAWLLVGTGGGWAQQAGPGAGAGAEPARCMRMAEWGGSFVTGVPGGSMEEVGRDACRFRKVRFGLDRAGYEAASVLVRGLPLPEYAAGAVRIEARGLKLSVHTGSAKADWMLQQQQVSSFDVVVDFEYDPAVRRVVLHEFSVDGELMGRVAVAGVFEGVPGGAGVMGMVPEGDDFGVRSVRVQLDSRRFVTSFLLGAVVSMLPDEDPVGSFERGRAMAAVVATRLLGAAGGGAEDRAAVLGLIRDFPQPRHAFEMSFVAGAKEGVVRPAALVEAVEKGVGVEALLAGSTVTASYDGAVR